jgi:septum formation protein
MSEITHQFVLASRSPRRESLLREAGYQFIIDPADVDEDDYPPEVMPADLASRLARMKSFAVAARRPNEIVLGADTVVAFGDKVLGKPKDAADAKRMLRLLSGTTHVVITGVSLICRDKDFHEEKRELSGVRMRELRDDEIEKYVQSNEWVGKAGGYGIQDNDPFVKCMWGCHSNVVGLPMKLVQVMLSSAGIFARKST